MSNVVSPAAPHPVESGPELVPFPENVQAEYRAAGYWLGEPLGTVLAAAGSAHAIRTALITADVTLTYDELWQRSRAFAAGLPVVAGVRSGDAVMFQMGNTAETVVAYLGCLLAGARPVCTLPQHGAREIGLLAEHVAARCLITQADFGRGQLVEIAQALRSSGVLPDVIVARGELDGAHRYDDVLSAGAAAGDKVPEPSLNPAQIAVFQLSGGTTGLPKVAPRLHEEYEYNSRAWASAMGWGPGSVVLYPLPLMHNAGISLALQPVLLTGGTLVLAGTAEVDTILDLLEAHRPCALPLVPPALAIRLLDHTRSRDVDFSGVSDFIVGGQKLPVEIAEHLRDELGIEVRQMFGMAEGMFFLTPPGASEQIRHHTVGAPLSPHDEVRILQPGSEDEVPDGEIGELCARGPYTIRGYYRAPQHNRDTFTRDGFYRTGDLARLHRIDGQECYSIDGRIKDVINRGAEKIHAEEVEELIVRHPGVATAALVAMPDPLLGEKPCAFLVLEPGASPLTPATLGQHLAQHGLSRYKHPERVEIVDQLPLTNVGKVSKKALREDIARKVELERAGTSPGAPA